MTRRLRLTDDQRGFIAVIFAREAVEAELALERARKNTRRSAEEIERSIGIFQDALARNIAILNAVSVSADSAERLLETWRKTLAKQAQAG